MIPYQLCDRRLRFFLVGHGVKTPLEKGWNRHRNYHYDDPILVSHVKGGGNYGVLCGCGGLLVLDFDDKEYYEQVRGKLPETFTVLSAGKRLPHLYYFVKGGLSIRKVAIIGSSGKVVCDVQSARVGIVGPGSSVAGRSYDVVCDAEVATIPLSVITALLPEKKVKRPRLYLDCGQKEHPLEIEKTLRFLIHLGVKRTKERHFECPFHHIRGKGNLHVFGEGFIHCFHEGVTWKSRESFKADLAAFRDGGWRV